MPGQFIIGNKRVKKDFFTFNGYRKTGMSVIGQLHQTETLEVVKNTGLCLGNDYNIFIPYTSSFRYLLK